MKERKRHLIEVFLLIIITLYERETRAFRNYWYDPDPPHYCDRKVRLADFGQLPVIFLNSFPGSGNTWSRQLIEDTTGFYSGSVYMEATMVEGGFVGEFDQSNSGRTIVVKNHGQREMERAEGIVLVIRNPYDAILADFNRQMSGSHTGSTDYSKFKGEVWENFVKQHAGRWGNSHLWYPTFAKRAKIPIHIIFYENLKIDVQNEMRKLLSFFENEFSLEFPDKEWRLDCLLKHQAKFFRKKKAQPKDLFSKEQIEMIDSRVRQVQILFETYNLEKVSSDYYRNPTRLPRISESEVLNYVNGSRITPKIDQRLQLRQSNLQNKKMKPLFALNPFKYD